MNDKTLGEMLRNCREEMHMNYSQVERQTGVPHDLVKRIEENRYNPKRLTLISLFRLSRLYEIPIHWVCWKLEEEIHAGN